MEKEQKIQLCRHPSSTNVLGHCIKEHVTAHPSDRVLLD